MTPDEYGDMITRLITRALKANRPTYLSTDKIENVGREHWLLLKAGTENIFHSDVKTHMATREYHTNLLFTYVNDLWDLRAERNLLSNQQYDSESAYQFMTSIEFLIRIGDPDHPASSESKSMQAANMRVKLPTSPLTLETLRVKLLYAYKFKLYTRVQYLRKKALEKETREWQRIVTTP